jgi:hypothetical protein
MAGIHHFAKRPAFTDQMILPCHLFEHGRAQTVR